MSALPGAGDNKQKDGIVPPPRSPSSFFFFPFFGCATWLVGSARDQTRVPGNAES